MKINVQIDLSDLTPDSVSTLLSTALSGSWTFGVDWNRKLYEECRTDRNCLEDNLAAMILKGYPIEIYDVEDEDSRWSFGIEQILSVNNIKNNERLTNLIIDWLKAPENLDLIAADLLLQYMLFGEIMFG